MKLKSKYLRAFCLVCAAVLLTAALSVSAYAADSIADQMAANSAAWWVAHNAGDQATCDALHAANEALAAQAASGGGSSSYNSAAGTWDISTSSGSNISSSSSQDGKQTTATYTTTTSSGSVSSTSTASYSDASIYAYYDYGGTSSGLQTSYNNAAAAVTSSNAYGSAAARNSAAGEVAVAKALLGLTDAEAYALQRDLETSKQSYDAAQKAYENALKRGDTGAANRAKAQMDAAHEAAEATRARYNYTGDVPTSEDGGYYHGGGRSSGGSGGGFYISTGVTATYNITASSNEGGAISPAGTTTVRKGQSQSYTITPSNGYQIKSVTVDGTNQGAISSYTFSNVTSSHTINATFEKKANAITAAAGNGGSISPSGTVSVEYGGSKTFTITPSSGWKISAVTVDGVNKGAISSYTFSNVTSIHTINASFEKKTYTITASAGNGGSISPSGTVAVEHGSSKAFTITPSSGWKISAVTVDGVNKGAISSYSFSNITGPHTISASFVPSGEIRLDTPTVQSTTGVNAASGAIKSGYGITASAHATYSDVTNVRLVMTYNFGDGVKTVVLEETTSGRFEFPVNASSPTGARCVYIPVATADGTYTLTYTMTAKNAADETLTKTSSTTLTVKGSMYEDDFTGDS